MTNTLLTELQSLDAAPETALNDTEQRRADARLQQILATAVTSEPSTPRPVSRRSTLRWAILPAFALAAVAAIVLIPGGGNSGSAFASWTATTIPLSATDQAIAGDACFALGGSTAGSEGIITAERRGDWVNLGYVDTSGLFAHCLLNLPEGSGTATDVRVGSASESDAVPVGGQFAEGPMSSSRDRGFSLFGGDDASAFISTTGVVGDNVSAVTIRTVDGLVVEATVQNGRYIAWFPGTGGATGDSAPVLAYDITLRDGTRVIDATPTMP